MKVRELKNLLDLYDDDLEVVIPVHKGTPSVGATPTIPVQCVGSGIDWDNGKLFFRPEDKLSVEDDFTKWAREYLNHSIDTYYGSLMTGDKKQLSRNLRYYFEQIMEKSGYGKTFEKQLEKTETIRQEAIAARKKAQGK